MLCMMNVDFSFTHILYIVLFLHDDDDDVNNDK